ncbi:S9 family peptidase [Pedobacter yulinensis]|uniref:S9 family peptidase n=1 Tax=Pedobacter yulinensis TaxID=2126353 RepID=A0A2T3HLJ7_9SPHI|nr:DPP IV N-terminal domain-containing protein [Pedobacter yulinensis]PST83317.1 S9 family peptidase [Pedobacter yulinensis]
MILKVTKKLIAVAVLSVCMVLPAAAQKIRWTEDGNGYYAIERGNLVSVSLPKTERKVLVAAANLKAEGKQINIRDFAFSADGSKVLIYTNSKKVWRYDTRGDYWVLDLKTQKLARIGRDKPASSLMFAKFSPSGNEVAYVSEHNLYVDDLSTGITKALTLDGTKRLINGTFDWAYEEEFDCRDGFRWSPDGRSLAYWQIDATKIKNFLMIDNIDSIYSYTIPVEYPKVGQDPSACKIGIVDIATAKTSWVNVPGDQVQNYIPRMEWIPGTNNIILQQLNREQNESKLFIGNAANGSVRQIFSEKDKAWIDAAPGWNWISGGKEFIWQSEKDGWKHLYRLTSDGKRSSLITKGDYDIIELKLVDEKNNYVYFLASPANATQRYLFRTKLDGKGKLEQVTPSIFPGTHNYDISPNGLFARHTFSSAAVAPIQEWMNLSTGNPLTMDGSLTNQLAKRTPPKNKVEFFQVTTEDGVTLDGWMQKPADFNPSKKYPVVFYVYGEPASQTVTDTWGAGQNFLYAGDMMADGYVYVSLENRGAPAPKGREWRKSIYQKIGTLNIRDQAQGAKKLLASRPYLDAGRVAVWGWSGGGSSTLNLLFQYPDIYQTGIAIAAVGNQLTYDNIYQERYMGSPLKTTEAYVKGSPITYAGNLKGNLLYIHGTGDDNVHYQNAEMLINELIRHGKTFQMMAYPNRTHSISEGEGTGKHLSLTYTRFLKEHCPPGAR